MLRSSNPVLKDSTFRQNAASSDGAMTIQGTVNKTFLLLCLVLVGGSFSWNTFTVNPASVMGMTTVAAIIAFVLAIATVFKPTWVRITAPAYAIVEGVALGGLSAVFEAQYPGIVYQAVFLTITTLLGLLMAYKSRLIQVTENFRLGIFAATAGIALFYVADLLLGFFGVRVPVIHSTGFFGIGFSVFVVAIAALNLVLDFDFIEKGSQQGAPKYMEWYGAFGLLVTLVWLYIEILRLLSKLRSRD